MEETVYIVVTKKEHDTICRLLNTMTRLDYSSHPSALDKAEALTLYRKLRSQR